jgi:hypothetical protein
MNPPRPGRLYWICQAAGWGSFTAWVLGWYLLSVPAVHLWDVVSIVFFNAVLCPAITHALRRYMYRRDWMQWPARRVLLWVVGVIVLTAASLTAGVALFVLAVSLGANTLDFQSACGIFIGFAWAYSGWFIIYYAVHSRRRRDALQLELAVVARDAQLRSLRSQLNPHFLFNCLNSLRHLIVSNPDRAVTMVTGLAELLRYSLASDRVDMVSLGEELQVVDEYLELERVRFEERLRIERAIEPAALGTRIPPMLIQGLVDNAIKHGIAELPRGGVVQIGARVHNSHVEIRVANTGRLTPTAAREGYGLKNASERLRLLYNGAASLTVNDVDGMTVAELKVPTA